MATFPTNPAADPLAGDEVVPITQGGVDKRTTVQDIADLAAGGASVATVVAGTGIDVDATDPANPEVSLDAATIASLALADSALQNAAAFATAAEGALAASATQPGDLAAIATSGDILDATGFPGGTTDFLRADGSFAAPPGGGGGTGDVVGPASATADAVALFDGTTGKLLKDGITVAAIRSVPQNSRSAAYTMTLSDAGGHILHPSADTTARTFTVPANSSVAFPIGTAITIVNQNAAGVVTIAITTDTMRLAGAGTTGSRTLAANGIATLLKITATEWLANGTGLT